MKAIIPLNKANKWHSYRTYRVAWWLSPFAVVTLFLYATIEIAFGGLLGFMAYTIFVSYLACPICDFPVGYNGHAKFQIFRPSPFGGWCCSCGKRLFIRRHTSI